MLVRVADDPKATFEVVRRLGPAKSAMLWLRYHSMPFKYHSHQPLSRALIQGWVSKPRGMWYNTYRWDPATDREWTHGLLQRLLQFIERSDARLIVVNLPEHPFSRTKYQPGRYELYLEILKDGLGGTPFLDLRTLLGADEFYDVVHLTPAAAQRLTRTINRFLKKLPPRKAPK
jgi:hypothetical protein